MAREIRITIDDDEVFERMKRQKRTLDLSWEDVLHRGLWSESAGDPREQRRRDARRTVEDDLGDRLERRIRQRVEDSLEQAFGIEESSQHTQDSHTEDHGYEEEMESLANAEDARLVFPFLEDNQAYQVPLRVELQMRAGDVDVEVVTVRQGKSVEEMNVFDRAARKQIAEKLAAGGPIVLELESGIEEYNVAPVLGWSRDDRGAPTVSSVEIDAVIFDEET